MMKRRVLVKGMILGIVFLTACANGGIGSGERVDRVMFPQYPVYRDVEELANEATHIIRGQVLGRRVEWVNTILPEEVIGWEMARLQASGWTWDEIAEYLDEVIFHAPAQLYTIYWIRVLEAFYGHHSAGSVIEVRQLGGSLGHVRLRVEGATTLRSGSELVLFLRSWESTGLPYTLVNLSQGAYYFPDDWALDTRLSSVNTANSLVITLEDLVRIAEANRAIAEQNEIWELMLAVGIIVTIILGSVWLVREKMRGVKLRDFKNW